MRAATIQPQPVMVRERTGRRGTRATRLPRGTQGSALHADGTGHSTEAGTTLWLVFSQVRMVRMWALRAASSQPLYSPTYSFYSWGN